MWYPYSRRVAQCKVEHYRTSFSSQAAVIVATVGRIIILIVPVAEAVPEAMVKVIWFCNSIRSCWYDYSSSSAPAGTVTVASVVV
jgi:hypothetical protein